MATTNPRRVLCKVVTGLRIPIEINEPTVVPGIHEERAGPIGRTRVVAGQATDGERQNGKGNYFEKLVVEIMEAAYGRTINARRQTMGPSRATTTST